MSTFALPATAARPLALVTAFDGRGWKAYLLVAALLVPFVQPSGPAQLAMVDVVNVVALVAFGMVALVRRTPVVLPFVVPLLFIVTGSLLAVMNAVSIGASGLSLAQDTYLYAWLVLLVAVLSRQGDLVGFRLAWLLAADVAAVIVIVQAARVGAFPSELLRGEGFRPQGTFYGANMCADYLLLSLFVALSLWPRTGRPFLLFTMALILVGILVTKSNGTLGALFVGAAATVLVCTFRNRVLRLRTLGAIALALGLLIASFWAFEESGLAAQLVKGGRTTVLGRMTKSAPGRMEIWSQLVGQVQRHPLGIGPGNSVFQVVPIGHRERSTQSFQSKEAHSDYVGYATERGPIGLVGHLVWVVAGIALVLGGANARRFGSRETLVRAALVGGLVASAVHSLVVEKLHFRHYWLFLALACALAAGERFRSESRS